MAGLVGGRLLVGGLGPRPPGPPLKSGPVFDTLSLESPETRYRTQGRTGVTIKLERVAESTAVDAKNYKPF